MEISFYTAHELCINIIKKHIHMDILKKISGSVQIY